MATPTKTEIWDQISKYIKIIDALYKFGATNTPNFVAMQDTLVQSFEGNHVPTLAAYLQEWRNEINGRYNAGRTELATLFIELAKFGYSINTIGKPERQIFTEIAVAMNTAGDTIKSRDYTYGAIVTPGANVGSSTVLRNVKDKTGNDLEIAVAGVQRVEIVQDKNLGAVQGSELVRFFGQGNPRVDRIQYADSTSEVLDGQTLQRSVNSVLNSGSFDTLETGAALTKNEQQNWTLSDFADFERDTSVFFRYSENNAAKVNGIGVSLKAKSNTNDISFAQYVAREKLQIEKNSPYFLVLRFYKDNALTDGSLTLRLGSQTFVQALVGLAANTWHNIVIGTDEKGYFDNFKENWISPANQDLGVRVEVSVTGRTVAGTYNFDEMVLKKGILFNGTYFLPLAGSNSGGAKDALEGDHHTFIDSEVQTGRNQYTIAELMGVSFPSTTGAPTFPDA